MLRKILVKMQRMKVDLWSLLLLDAQQSVLCTDDLVRPLRS